MGDAALTADEANFNFDMAAFYTNFLQDIRDTQSSYGSVPDTVPHTFGSKDADPSKNSILFRHSLGWGTAYPTILHTMMVYKGDKQIVKEQLPSVKKYIEWLVTLAEKSVPNMMFHYGDSFLPKKKKHKGDWVPPPDMKKENSSLCTGMATSTGKKNRSPRRVYLINFYLKLEVQKEAVLTVRLWLISPPPPELEPTGIFFGGVLLNIYCLYFIN